MTDMTDREKIEILIDQVGRMTESITELRMGMRESVMDLRESVTELRTGMQESVSELRGSVSELRETVEHGFDELRSLVTTGFTELKTVSERQERNIDRLVGIVETLIQERR